MWLTCFSSFSFSSTTAFQCLWAHHIIRGRKKTKIIFTSQCSTTIIQTHLIVLRCYSRRSVLESSSMLASVHHSLSFLDQNHQPEHGQSCQSERETPLGVVCYPPPKYRRHSAQFLLVELNPIWMNITRILFNKLTSGWWCARYWRTQNSSHPHARTVSSL